VREPEPHIRPYRPSDLGALYDICLRTGAAGRDATDLVEDPRLLGELYAAPYALFEPELAFVVDDGSGAAVGYVLGARDTVAFEARCERDWWPALRARHPLQPDGERLDDLLIGLIHHRTPHAAAVLAAHPSHLHIDLLAPIQGQGWGRRLIDTLTGSLRAAGSPGVHLGVSTRNRPAIAFYRRLGFTELGGDGLSRTFGQRL
jgi:ribosomal protein S18 acetylase RimI-like enzyme